MNFSVPAMIPSQLLLAAGATSKLMSGKNPGTGAVTKTEYRQNSRRRLSRILKQMLVGKERNDRRRLVE